MKDTLKVIGLGLLMVVGLILLLYAVAQVGEPDSKEIEAASSGTVFYLPYTSDFGKHLSEFITAHPELRVVSIAPLDNVGNGATRGYWVLTEKKEESHGQK